MWSDYHRVSILNETSSFTFSIGVVLRRPDKMLIGRWFIGYWKVENGGWKISGVGYKTREEAKKVVEEAFYGADLHMDRL